MRKITGSLATVAAAGVLTFAALPVASASAGSNGQQLSICTTPNQHEVEIEGTNQNGDPSQERITVTPGVCELGQNMTRNWWWVGPVAIGFLEGEPDPNGSYVRQCLVPKRWRDNSVLC
jgi:hypothetical protein